MTKLLLHILKDKLKTPTWLAGLLLGIILVFCLVRSRTQLIQPFAGNCSVPVADVTPAVWPKMPGDYMNKSGDSVYESKYETGLERATQHQPFKFFSTLAPLTLSPESRSSKLDKPWPKDLAGSQLYNQLLYIKSGTRYLAREPGSSGNILFLAQSSIVPGKMVEICAWKAVLGLSGDANTLSLYHPDSASYITRKPNGRLALVPASVIEGVDTGREASTFRLIDGLNNRDHSAIMPLAIGSETVNRVLMVDGVVPHMVKYDADSMMLTKGVTDFELVDINNGWLLVTNSKGSMESFQDYSSGGSGHCDKSSSKRALASSVREGSLRNNELSTRELFQNSTDAGSGYSAFGPDFDPATANIFQEHTGAEFNEILQKLQSQRTGQDEMLDKVFYKLENAKLDPNVENLLEYNAVRNKIYVDENNNFEKKISDRIKRNTGTMDDLILDMNNYRVQNMSRDYFFLKNNAGNAGARNL